jgi:hypothetical protein
MVWNFSVVKHKVFIISSEGTWSQANTHDQMCVEEGKAWGKAQGLSRVTENFKILYIQDSLKVNSES